MKKSSVLFVAGVVCAFACASLYAADRGTPAEAQALIKKAVEHFKSVGRKQALEDFTGKKSPWVDRDLYVACIDANHMIVANGAFPSYVGMKGDVLKDANGVPVSTAAWDGVKKSATGEAAIEYPWFNPVTGKMEQKVTYFQKVADDVICGVGVYKAAK